MSDTLEIGDLVFDRPIELSEQQVDQLSGGFPGLVALGLAAFLIGYGIGKNLAAR